jgi:hypothetical protein
MPESAIRKIFATETAGAVLAEAEPGRRLEAEGSRRSLELHAVLLRVTIARAMASSRETGETPFHWDRCIGYFSFRGYVRQPD